MCLIHKQSLGRTKIYFLLFNFVLFMLDGTTSYFSIYLEDIGFDPLRMGVLFTGATVTAVLLGMFLGFLADRSSNMNRLLLVTLLVAMLTGPLFLLSKRFIYVALVYTAYTVCRSFQRPLSDTITLDYTRNQGGAYGPIRAMGSVGYAAMAMFAARMAKIDIVIPFYLLALVGLAGALILRKLPRVSGRHRPGHPPALRALLQYRPLVMLTLFSIAFSATKLFHLNYYSVHFVNSIGGSIQLYGLLLSGISLLELPVIYFIDIIYKRFGARRIIIFCALVDGLRWMAAFALPAPIVQTAVQALLGVTTMLYPLTITLYINKMVAPEHKVSALTTHHTVTTLSSVVLGNLLGGALGNLFGLGVTFLICSLTNLGASVVFALVSKNIMAADAPDTPGLTARPNTTL